MRVKVNEQVRKQTTLSTADLLPGKIYEVLGKSNKMGWYRIVDESGEDYLYPPSLFDVVET